VDFGTPNAPGCSTGGTTGEWTNLFWAAPPSPDPRGLPAVVFTESTAVGSSYACDSAVSIDGTTKFYQQGNKLVGGGYVGPAGGGAEQGISIALSADGTTALIGGPADNNDIGAAWVFTQSGSVWSQQGNKLVGGGYVGPPGSGAYQGASVALSADGNTAIVGGPSDNFNVGAVWVWTRSGGVWNQQGNKLFANQDEIGAGRLGYSVALSADGNTAITGGPKDNAGTGAAWVFSRSGGTPASLLRLTDSPTPKPPPTTSTATARATSSGRTPAATPRCG
jgi:hypothetical protein